MRDQFSLVSIITPTYNHERFIGDCIQSVLNQTYPNWEQIIIDDGSTDRTGEIVKQWIRRDARIRYLKHSENKGPAAARNTGIKYSQGSIIALLDADDVWLNQKLEIQLEELRKGADFVYADAFLFNDKNVFLNRTYWEEVKTTPCKGGKCLVSLFRKNVMSPTSSFFFKKQIFEEIGGFNEHLKSSEDYDFCLRGVSKGYSVSYIDSPLLYIRTPGKMRQRKPKMIFWHLYVIIKFLLSHPSFLLQNIQTVFLTVTRIGLGLIKECGKSFFGAIFMKHFRRLLLW